MAKQLTATLARTGAIGNGERELFELGRQIDADQADSSGSDRATGAKFTIPEIPAATS